AELFGLGGKAITGQRRQYQVERVVRLATVRGRVGERTDGLEQLDDRSGPAVRHDQRHRVLVLRLHVDKVDVDPIDLRLELRQRVQSRLALAPVVVGDPVASKSLDRRLLNSLRPVRYELSGGPAGCGDAPAKISERLFR